MSRYGFLHGGPIGEYTLLSTFPNHVELLFLFCHYALNAPRLNRNEHSNRANLDAVIKGMHIANLAQRTASNTEIISATSTSVPGFSDGVNPSLTNTRSFDGTTTTA